MCAVNIRRSVFANKRSRSAGNKTLLLPLLCSRRWYRSSGL